MLGIITHGDMPFFLFLASAIMMLAYITTSWPMGRFGGSGVSQVIRSA